MGKIVVLLSTRFTAKQPTQTITPTRSNTLGSPIKATRTEPDYRSCFRDWGWI